MLDQEGKILSNKKKLISYKKSLITLVARGTGIQSLTTNKQTVGPVSECKISYSHHLLHHAISFNNFLD